MAQSTPDTKPADVAERAMESVARLGSDIQRGLSSNEAAARQRRDGPNEIPEKKRHALAHFAGKFWSLSAVMLEIIALLSAALQKWTDAIIAGSLVFVNASLSYFQEQRANAAVAALRKRLEVNARVLRDGQWKELAARELVAGDIVRLRAGDFVPADLQLIEGTLKADQSALTGESADVERGVDGLVYSGSTVRRGEATGVVVATALRTYFGKTVELVQSARPRLHVEEVVSRVVKWLFVIVGVLVAVAIAGALLAGTSLWEILPLSLVLLMSAVPVALPVMFTVSMALGAMELGRRGVLVTRLSAAEDAATMDVLCADKTGTLTQNRLAFVDALPEEGFTKDDVLNFGAQASQAANQDPIDLAFLNAARERGLNSGSWHVVSFTPFSAQTRRTEAVVELEGRQTRVMKGALRTVAAEAGLTPEAVNALEPRAELQAKKGFRVLAIARAVGTEPLRFVGIALLRDPLRADAPKFITELRLLGIDVKMLTGDALAVAREMGRELGLPNIVRASDLHKADAQALAEVRGADGLAEVFPEDKFHVVQLLQADGHIVGMTGDGVNDAPALRQAEVGIAVSSATDVAKGAASVVLVTEGLASVVELVKIGRAVYQRVLTWIINKVSRTILKAGFVVAAFLFTGKFVISALGMILLVFMTDFVKIALSTDRVRPSPRPETWRIGPLIRLGAVLGVLMLGEALGLLAMGWRYFGLGRSDGRLETFSFLTLLFFALFSILSIRERKWFWSSRPGLALSLALAADAAVGVFIGVFGVFDLPPLPLLQSAVVIGCAAACILGPNDLLKRIVLARQAGKRAPVV